MKRAVVLLMVALPLIASGASAQITETPQQRCAAATGNDSITACSDVIGIGEGGAEMVWAYVARAHAYESVGYYASAASDLGDALQRKKDDPALLAERADDELAADHYAAALDDDDKLVDLNPSVENYARRCRLRAIANAGLDDAMDDCTDALKLGPTDGHALEARCFVNVRLAKWAAAIADCSAALDADWKMAPALYLRGYAKTKSGDAKGADGDFAAAQTLDPKVAETFEGYGIKP
jgi:tetratricopeptide (TPR) repeat protein